MKALGASFNKETVVYISYVLILPASTTNQFLCCELYDFPSYVFLDQILGLQRFYGNKRMK